MSLNACDVLDFKSSCVIKNRRKASNIKVLKFIDQNSARWVVSQTRVLQRSNNQKHFHRTFIKSVHVGRFFIGRRNRPTLLQSIFSSFVSLGSCKTTLNTLIPPVRAWDQFLPAIYGLPHIHIPSKHLSIVSS